MKFNKQYNKYILTALLSMSLSGCKITGIIFPTEANKNEVIEITINITDDLVPEPNANKGLLGVLLPDDWDVVDCDYAFDNNAGIMEIDAAWKDSIEAIYSAHDFGNGYKWIALVSDIGYTYDQPINIEVTLHLRTGNTDGCYDLAFLVTKATSGMISSKNSSWAPISYPHRIAVPIGNSCGNAYEVEEADEWSQLLDRDSGWSGADGIYSIPFDENERWNNNSKHLLLFSDTFIGTVQPNGQRTNSTIVNNTLALMNSNTPSEENIKFLVKEENGQAATMFVPNTPESKDEDWYWLMDGIILNGTPYVYALRLEHLDNPNFSFNYIGANLIKFNFDENDNVIDEVQFDTPLYYYDEAENVKYLLGQAIMPMHAASQNYSTDGYIYLYGPKDINNTKELICGRVLPENLEDFTKYEYWNSEGWSNQIQDCASITDQISQEFSVSPLPNGKFILVFQMGNQVAYRIGDSPVGPFGMFTMVYNCPEVEISDNIIIYNAKAHPSLSPADKLLISYNVNTLSLAENYSNADIYRPRFIYLTLDQATSVVSWKDESIPVSFKLKQNYPNPFNPSTVIEFEITEEDSYSLKLYNTLGQEIQTVFQNKILTAGKYSSKVEAGDLCSGVYYYRLANSKQQTTRKMMLLR